MVENILKNNKIVFSKEVYLKDILKRCRINRNKKNKFCFPKKLNHLSFRM
ncbi:MAG: hypothetical protein Q8830_01785 [Candidatus Phytoplasma australasiaticum]|nr:hypothetical protein [Candidatus Phytoplasma australasiaticum]MDV3192143.1 hypothetical protein [Candidatus Phytoplasma australasiaticum]